MKNKYSLVLVIIISFIFTSCSFRTDYPSIKYYRLNSEPSSKIQPNASIDASLLIRDVMVSAGNETDQMMTTSDNGSITKYYYHRWISDIPSLVSDFFRERYTKFGLFKGGISKSASAIIPNYVLEISLIEFQNISTSKGSSYVEVTALATVIEYPKGAGEQMKKLFVKVFTSKEYKRDNEVTSIAPAFSKALNNIADDIYLELYNLVNKNISE